MQTEAVWLEQGWGLVAHPATPHSLKNTITKTKHHSRMEGMLTGLPSSLARSYFPAVVAKPVIVSIVDNTSIKKEEGQLDVNGFFKELKYSCKSHLSRCGEGSSFAVLLRVNSFHVTVNYLALIIRLIP